MITQIRSITGANQSEIQEIIQYAATLLQSDQIVGFPTETVYGLGARIFSERAIESIYQAKGRPADNPLIAHVASIAEIYTIATDISPLALDLIREFFPGPLTVVLPKHPSVPTIATAGLHTIAVRMPQSEIARALITATGEPLVAPSANLSGKPSPTSAQHVFEDMKSRIPLIIDGGECEVGIESTVIHVEKSTITILRKGAVTREDIEKYLEQLPHTESTLYSIQEYSSATDNLIDIPTSPGMKYRHYAPDIPVVLIQDTSEISTSVPHVILTSNPVNQNEWKLDAATLYSHLRTAEKNGYSTIYIVCSSDILSQTALYDRIVKASS